MCKILNDCPGAVTYCKGVLAARLLASHETELYTYKADTMCKASFCHSLKKLALPDLPGSQVLRRALALHNDDSLLPSMVESDSSLYASGTCISFGGFVLT
jgi:hypothetical protein